MGGSPNAQPQCEKENAILRTAILLALLVLLEGTAGADVVVVPIPQCTPLFQSSPEGERLSADGFSVCTAPGSPALLFRDIDVLLPQEADPSSLSAEIGSPEQYVPAGTHDIAPAPPLKTFLDGVAVLDWAGATRIRDGRDLDIYAADAFYPASSVGVLSAGCVRGYKIVRVRYYPLQYNPVTRELRSNSSAEIRITYQPVHVLQSVSAPPSDTVLSDQVARWVANPEGLDNWYSRPAARAFTSATSTTTTDYLILTTSAIATASTKLQAFINHKINRGFRVGVATEAQWGGGTGDTAANRIRAYLKSNYASKGIKYVLLVGDPTPSSGSVPMKMLWPRRGSGMYEEAPSDYFYADLTGNWDLDGDGYYGEGTHDFGTGGVDIYPEVIVGRIPVYGSDIASLDSILQKTIDYESGGIGGDWIKTALLSMKPSDASTPGYNLGEAIKKDALPTGFTARRVYEQTYGLNPAPDLTPCSYDTVKSAWTQHSGFHFWWTHGNETLAADVMTSDRTSYLDDRYPSFTFQCSCLNGSPENSNNLGYALLKRGAVATVSATRVSWYYPGETTYTNTDSNAGMTYRYALHLIRDHMPAGDALYAVMVEIPSSIWMNRCVFNLYGDPSLAYASGPVISHVPHPDTDVTTQPYDIQAQITSSGALQSTSPILRWNTNGGSTFNQIQMTAAGGSSYSAQIPAKPLGTTIYYYITAVDTQSRTALSPTAAPSELHSFRIRADFTGPVVQHTPLTDTGDKEGPYTVRATITDDSGVSQVMLSYQRNGGATSTLAMSSVGSGVYEAAIPGPTAAGDTISYYITAADASTVHNVTRSPAQGAYSFLILGKIRVAIYNCSTVPPYFTGSNSNIYQQISTILGADPAARFDPIVVTDLSASTLADKAAIVLPDNAVSTTDAQAVSNWFVKGKVIMTLESGTCYAAYSGFLWPQMAGLNGYNAVWDTNAGVGDQEVVLQDSVTSGYTLGQVIEARGYEAQFFIDSLPSDAKVLTRSKNNTTRAYAVYRDVPGRGRIVALGPYVSPGSTHYSIIREGLVVPSTDRALRLTGPAAGTVFEIGQRVTITYQTTGTWQASDRVKLEYYNGLDTSWHTIAGAESLVYSTGSYSWNTTGLIGSCGYKVRVSLVGGSVSAQSDAPFTIAANLSIPMAKSVSDGQAVKLSDKIVTAVFGAYSYLEEPNRQGGLKVQTASPLTTGATAQTVGAMATVDGERVLMATNVSMASAAAKALPVTLTTAALGGGTFGGQQAVAEYRVVKQGSATSKVLTAGRGLNNIGLLVRVTGKVTAVGSDYFYIDDGAKCDDGSGLLGVRVICGSASKPSVGRQVLITAVSGTYYERGGLWKALLMTGMQTL
jgi:hypothetical protein